MEPSFLPRLAFEALKEAETVYKEKGSFPDDVWENLHSFFGENLILATELLEKCRLVEYIADNHSRSIFKIVGKHEQYTIYDNINFCQCEVFRIQVLESRNSVTCKHILALKLGQITDKIIRETVTGSQLVDFLNEQLNIMEENKQ
ncbi:unnamed protein product [Phaedon cochleariae]|uniref:SWIM-type domain-containing protein n=1 Tax=Phaedon cochleariae TaxID=80249 RepID=A0A9P0GP52_PHACE|nr:unnamed protein product [Phaedon cochleariae]